MNKEKVMQWIKAEGVRAVKTVAKTIIATIGTSAKRRYIKVMLKA